LYRIKKRNLHVPRKPIKKPQIKDSYEIALALYKGYLGFLTALKIHGLTEYEPFTIQVITTNASKTKSIGDYVFKAIVLKEKAVGATHQDGYWVSSLEKTFFDCFYKPTRCGGYAVITKALYENQKMNWHLFTFYFKKFASNALCQRTGYVLDTLNKKTNKEIIPEEVIKYFKQRISTKTRLNPSIKKAGKYNKEWKVMVNEKNTFSWWY